MIAVSFVSPSGPNFMAARSKKRAKFDYGGRTFLWHVDAETWVRICSADKQFIVAVPLLHDPGREDLQPRCLTVIGREFPFAPVERRPLDVPLPTWVADSMRISMGALVHAVLRFAFDREVGHHGA